MPLTVVLDDKNPHLGGNSVELNRHTYSPDAWKYIVNKYNIKSMMDVGSGYGHTPKWFSDYGLNPVIAIEGLEKNVKNAIIPTIHVDLTEKSYMVDVEMVHCVEVVEHINEKYLDNLLDTLCCGKYIFMTHGLPGQKGHHHVNNQPPQYWINHINTRGFVLIEEDSRMIKKLSPGTKKGGYGKHINESGLFFKRR